MPTSFDWLKIFDMFKAPVTTYITATDQMPEEEKQLKRYKDKKFRLWMGSLSGGIVSIFFASLMVVYVAFQLALIQGSEKDIFKSVETANLFNEPAFQEARMDQYNFLPSLSIREMSSFSVDFDVYEGEERYDQNGNMKIDAEKLKNYLEVVLSIRERKQGINTYY